MNNYNIINIFISIHVYILKQNLNNKTKLQKNGCSFKRFK